MSKKIPVIYGFLVLIFSCSHRVTSHREPGNRETASSNQGIQIWLTQPDRSALFAPQKNVLPFTGTQNQLPSVTVEATKRYQQMAGFGFCLTDGSAYLINQMDDTDKSRLLEELFSTKGTSIGISYIRISIGASDLSRKVYSYDDLPEGQTDTALLQFSIAQNKKDLIPVLKAILKINPSITILGSPWSAPVWMKDNNRSEGGSLQSKYYGVYAGYLVKYIRAMEAEGINIDAITPQNEPLNPKNNPSMYMSADEEKDFIKNDLGPAFTKEGLSTKIICYDHNADESQYPLTILQDPAAAKYVDGSAFHLYAGDVSALGKVHEAFPGKHIYFTEQYTGSGSTFAGDLSWAIENLVIGATRNWSRNVLEWNLASDPNLEPHTNGGCNTCLGAVTISGNKVTTNQSYYIIAHASKFVRPGSYRIRSSEVKNLPNVAFLTPGGQIVLVVLNTSKQQQSFNIRWNGNAATTSLNAGAVATYVW